MHSSDAPADGSLHALQRTSATPSHEESKMLYWAAVFFIIAIVAAVFGFGGVAAGATSIAQILFGLFLLIAVVSLILGMVRRH
jgi:uncharacterized membrane protein YtjA (UPF0391 family)